LPKARVCEYLPYRMLEVEVAANAVYAWAAEQIVSRRLAGEGGVEGAEFAAAVRYEAQALRYRTHEKLIRAFLDPEVFVFFLSREDALACSLRKSWSSAEESPKASSLLQK
jgi:hypothetical protein